MAFKEHSRYRVQVTPAARSRLDALPETVRRSILERVESLAGITVAAGEDSARWLQTRISVSEDVTAEVELDRENGTLTLLAVLEGR